METLLAALQPGFSGLEAVLITISVIVIALSYLLGWVGFGPRRPPP